MAERADPGTDRSLAGAAAGGARAGALRHLPNMISALRVLLIPPVALAVHRGAYTNALLLVLLAGFSDGLDGFLAKRFHWQSQLGAMLDPIADKLLFVTLFVLFALHALLPPWLVVVVIGRDLVIVTGALAFRLIVGPFVGAATRLSKMNTALLLLLGLAVLGAAALDVTYADAPDAMLARALVILGATAFCTTVLSGVHYVTSWGRRAHRKVTRRGLQASAGAGAGGGGDE